MQNLVVSDPNHSNGLFLVFPRAMDSLLRNVDGFRGKLGMLAVLAAHVGIFEKMY